MGNGLSLFEKDRILEKNIVERHLIDGLYTSIILVDQKVILLGLGSKEVFCMRCPRLVYI